MGEIILRVTSVKDVLINGYLDKEGLTIPRYAQNVNYRIGISLERLKRRNMI
jgi:hypothetical protein